MKSFINKDNFPSAKNYMSIPMNFCFLPLDTVRLPKCSDIVSISFVFTSSSTCDTLLSSTYHNIVHCLSWMVLFAMNLSYGLTRNPCNFRVFEYRSYHSSADSMHPYKDFRRRRYSTLNPFSMRTFFLCSVFTSHMMSTNFPSILNKMNLSSGMSALRYDLGTSEITRLFLHVHQWWGWWTKLWGKWSVRMRLIWSRIFSGVVYLRTSSLLGFRSVFILSSLWPSVLLSSVIL